MKKVLLVNFKGGGLRGYLSSLLLEELAKQVDFLKDVTLFSGTSTGSFIALSLALGKSPHEVTKFYTNYAPHIFKPTRFKRARMFKTLFTPKYSNEPLKQAVWQIYGTKRIRDLKTKVLIPAYNFDDDEAKYFDSDDGHEFIADVSLKSSAIPMYFDVYKDDSNVNWLDGGVFANDPTDAAIAQAVCVFGDIKAELSDVWALTIGTGITPKKSKPFGHQKLGVYQLLQRKEQLARILLESKDTSTKYKTENYLGKRFFYLDAQIPHLPLDDIEILPKIHTLVNGTSTKSVTIRREIKRAAEFIKEFKNAE